MKELTLSVSRDKKNTEKIKNSNHSENCYFCGIGIKHNPYVHIKDGKTYSSCSLCFHSENLDLITSLKKGDILFLTDISQIDLLCFIRLLWYIEYCHENASNKELKEQYDNLLADAFSIKTMLSQRVEYTDEYIAIGAHNVNYFSNFLSNIPIEDYEKRKLVTKYLRWIPDKDFFKNDLNHWFENDFKKYNILEMIKNVRKK